MATKKTDVPDIGSLLGTITKKRDEIPKTEIQHVQAVKPLKQENSKTPNAGGRPTVKPQNVEYVKVSPRIPKQLKKRVEIALVEERFKDRNGRSITTLDEIIAHALHQLLD
jgi:hypothetical protein